MVVPGGSACAGAFFIPQQSVADVGTAFQGGAVMARDASTIFSNPAGMTELEKAQITIGANILVLNVDVENRGSTATTLGSGGVPVGYSGNSGGNPAKPELVPNIFAAFPVIDKDLWAGIGITAPFGLGSDYNDQWFGRYDSIQTELLTTNISPTLAYRVNQYVSLGVGLDVQYADAKLSNAVPDTLNPGGPTLATDGRARVKGDDWSFGFNAGVLIKPFEGTRVGIHYRSPMDHNLKGNLRISRLTGGLAGLNSTSHSQVDLDLPEIVTVGVAHDVTPELTVMSQFQWFGWSRFNEIRIRSTANPDLVRKENYEDSITIGIGAEYKLPGSWILRGGFQFDQTPIRDKYRTTSVPTNNAYWLGLGASYSPTEDIVLNVAYARTFFEDGNIDLDRKFFEGSPAQGQADINARAKNSGDTFSVNFTYRF